SAIKPSKTGGYAVFNLKKKNYTTERAVQHIIQALHMDRKRIGYAGNKDRVAVTEQNISIKNIKKEKVENLKIKDIELKFIGYSKEPISLGDLNGNKFKIIVRNIEKSPICLKRIINYFGEQRFSRNNAEIGKAIIKKDFKKAVDRILDSIGEDEKKVIEHLKKNRNDFVGALKTMPWKILKLYIHAYQSKLWNETVKILVKKEIKEKKIPLIGFATEIKDKNVKKIVEKVMQNKQIDYNDFVIRAIPELSSEGSERNVYAEVKAMEIGELEDDELNKGKKKVKISFSLGKGSYGTEVVKAMF
ncbi:tRNA pseudouridine(13) synthase TruD, partial [Candidatus Woesearchaeota archaeon]|nr:tRNA pseudouridine(13) synthase TruD [Candidatus Woesearchaeota archaeon]